MNLRKLIFSIFYWTGILRTWIYFNRNKIIILAFHQIMENDENKLYVPLRECTSSNTLDRYLEVLCKYYNIISLEEAEKILSKKQRPKPYSVVITFDDGFRNNVTHAKPVLEKYGASMTIFLATALVNDRVPLWADRLDYAFLHYPKEKIVFNANGTKLVLSGNTRAEKAASFKEFLGAAKGLPCNDLEFMEVMGNLADSMERESDKKLKDVWESDDWSALLTWPEVVDASKEGVHFGSHTLNHYRLDRVDIETAKNQLTQSKRDIENHLDAECKHFAYPNGDYTNEVSELVKDLGYTCALTTIDGLNSVGCNLYQLKRIGISRRDEDNIEILLRISGLATIVSEFMSKFRS